MRLVVITGPTASGKTALAVKIAQKYGTEILSCDSRQFYRELRIGVARPGEAELTAARHHFIACRSVTQPYNVSQYEDEALALLQRLFERHDMVVAVGGSGLYIDALCHGMARMPDPDPELREWLKKTIRDHGLEPLRRRLFELDPDYYHRCDLNNPVRVQRALEVIVTTGRPYSQVVAQPVEPRPFTVEKIAVATHPDALRSSIDNRVDAMFEQGLADEVRTLLPFRNLITLNTVGYKELFLWLDGKCSLDQARQKIKTNTWHYAKKQLTWLHRYSDVRWLTPEQVLSFEF